MHLLCGARGKTLICLCLSPYHQFGKNTSLFFACLSFSGMDETMSFISLTNSTHCCYFMQKNLCLIFHLRYFCCAALSWAELSWVHCICYSHNIHYSIQRINALEFYCHNDGLIKSRTNFEWLNLNQVPLNENENWIQFDFTDVLVVFKQVRTTIFPHPHTYTFANQSVSNQFTLIVWLNQSKQLYFRELE